MGRLYVGELNGLMAKERTYKRQVCDDYETQRR
jgi:hypothetical protein